MSRMSPGSQIPQITDADVSHYLTVTRPSLIAVSQPYFDDYKQLLQSQADKGQIRSEYLAQLREEAAKAPRLITPEPKK